MNPGKILEDIIPARARKIIYLILALILLGFGAWQVAEGDWGVFIFSLVTALVNLLAASNTTTPPIEPETNEVYQPKHSDLH